MAISAVLVKELRDKTGVGFMDCKSALAESDGNVEKAIDILRTRGQAKAEKRAGRSTGQGLVGSYIHTGGQVGVLVEMGCESDFVARTDEFQALVREVGMHIAAANPTYGTRAEVPEADIEREKAIFRGQFEGSNKPAEVIEKIITGKLNRVATIYDKLRSSVILPVRLKTIGTITSSFGIINRTASFGRSYGLAFNFTLKTIGTITSSFGIINRTASFGRS